MTGVFIAIFGVWFVGVGWHGNGSQAAAFFKDTKGFIPWIVAILLLWFLYQVRVLRPVVGAIGTLAVVALIVTDYGKVQSQYQALKQSFGIEASK